MLHYNLVLFAVMPRKKKSRIGRVERRSATNVQPLGKRKISYTVYINVFLQVNDNECLNMPLLLFFYLIFLMI